VVFELLSIVEWSHWPLETGFIVWFCVGKFVSFRLLLRFAADLQPSTFDRCIFLLFSFPMTVGSVMRFLMSSFLFLFGLSIVGCGSDSAPETVDSNAIESYVADNPEAVAQEEALEAEQEAAEEAEEAEDD
jgi:hypothetical protein